MSTVQPPLEAPSRPEPPDSGEPSRRRGLAKLLVFFAILILLFASGALYVRSVSHGVDGPSTPVTVVIPEGSTGGQIAKVLATKKVIRNAWLFRLMARIDGRAGALKPGEYHLRTGMSYGDVLDALEAGPIIKIERFTVPEGKTLREIVDIIRRKTSLSAATFQTELGSGRYRLPLMPAGSKNLEGLLFPKTYDIREGTTEGQVVQMMLDQFTEETADLDFTKAKGITPYQAVVLASLIEREAKVPEDRARISAVIYNRIRRHMRLQIDATVQYAIFQQTGSYKARLTFDDYEISSPYNTYKIDGLPPAPIAAPGLASLQAAVTPEASDNLYYVLCDKRGGHAFAKTADEFDKLKRSCAGKR